MKTIIMIALVITTLLSGCVTPPSPSQVSHRQINGYLTAGKAYDEMLHLKGESKEDRIERFLRNYNSEIETIWLRQYLSHRALKTTSLLR